MITVLILIAISGLVTFIITGIILKNTWYYDIIGILSGISGSSLALFLILVFLF